MLIILGGLPGTGKTTVGKEVARRLGATYLRIDTIEQAIRRSHPGAVNDAGYRVAYAIAEENLREGGTVVADSVNPLAVTRDAWRNVAARAAAVAIEVELICSDIAEHRGRVEARIADIQNFCLPTWSEVLNREYEPWTRRHTVIDTAGKLVTECVEEVLEAADRAREMPCLRRDAE